MGQPVPADDLPAGGGGAVPDADLPVGNSVTGTPAAQADPWMQSGLNIVRGLRGGPVGAVAAAANEANQGLGRIAYDAGGAVTDVASGISGRHSVLNPLGLTIPPEIAAGLGYGTNVALQSIPVVAGGQAAKVVGAESFKDAGRSLMHSALKPDKLARESGKADQAVETMLQEGVTVSKGGVAKLRAEIDRLNEAIKDAIARSDAKVDQQHVVKTLDELAERVKMQVTPQADMAVVRKAMEDFLTHPLITSTGGQIPVQLAQQIKQGTYRMLGSKPYGELQGASVEAQKQLARGLKEGVSDAVPQIGPLNARESALLNAEEIAGARVLADANKNPIGLGWLNPITLPMWLLDRSPWAKSLLARALYSGSEQIPATGGRIAGAVAGGVSGQPRKDSQ